MHERAIAVRLAERQAARPGEQPRQAGARAARLDRAVAAALGKGGADGLGRAERRVESQAARDLQGSYNQVDNGRAQSSLRRRDLDAT